MPRLWSRPHLAPNAAPPPLPTIAVRLALPQDVPQIIQLMTVAHAESADAGLPTPDIDPSGLEQSLVTILNQGYSWAVESDGRIVGGLMAELTSKFWHPRPVCLATVHLYVAPPYRRGGAAANLLLGRFTAAARAIGLPAVIQTTFGIRPKATARLFAAHGFRVLA